MSFLTVEDYNTVNLNPVNKLHEIDTSKISSEEFENVLYDFCIVSHIIDGQNHIYTFEIENSLWCGGTRAFSRRGAGVIAGIPFSNCSYDAVTKTLTVTTTYSTIQVYLYLCSFAPFNFRVVNNIPCEDAYYITKNEIGTTKTIVFSDDGVSKSRKSVEVIEGVLYYDVSLYRSYILFLLKKTDLVYNLSDTVLQLGVNTKIKLNVDEDYLPDGELVGDMPLDISVKYNGSEIPVVYDETLNDYCFDLDLTKKIDDKPIKLDVIVYESEYVNGGIFNHNVNCEYVAADSFSSLQSLITAGNEIIELSSDITFTSNLTLPQNLYLIGNDHQIFMGDYRVFLENVSCKCEKVHFNEGSPVFVQGADSKLNVVDCVFNNATISDEYKGSVLSTLNKSNIVSTFSGCSIFNCHHSIWHCGTLIIDNCKALFNDFNSSADPDYSSLLTAYDCQIEITNSTFDIDYTDLCTDEIDIKYAESLICLGEDTTINGITVDKLTADNTLPVCTSQYNNKSHIYCKYYYPTIEECVIASPIPNFEDKAVCHTIMGQDWIYKNNVQVTKASAGNENTNRKIIWEE